MIASQDSSVLGTPVLESPQTMFSVSEANVTARFFEETDPANLGKDLPIGKSGNSRRNYMRLRREKVETFNRTMGDEAYDTPNEARITSSDVSQNALVTGGLDPV